MTRRTIDSDPATQGALGVPKILEAISDSAGMHRDGDIDLLLDPEHERDEVTAMPTERSSEGPPADLRVPEELAADAIALANQGGGSYVDEDEHSLEEQVDRDAITAGVVPQLVSQASLEAASEPERDSVDDDEEESVTSPRSSSTSSRQPTPRAPHPPAGRAPRRRTVKPRPAGPTRAHTT